MTTIYQLWGALLITTAVVFMTTAGLLSANPEFRNSDWHVRLARAANTLYRVLMVSGVALLTTVLMWPFNIIIPAAITVAYLHRSIAKRK